MNDQRTSVWQSDEPTAPVYDPLPGDLDVDIAIIGAGITGLTCAALLKRAGFAVAVFETDTVGAGVTGKTTAHLSTFPDWGYTTISQKFGRDGARVVAESMTRAVTTVERLCEDLSIRCELTRVPGYYYSERSEDASELEQEFDAAAKTGIAVGLSREVPLPFAAPLAVVFERQGQFHPLRYLHGLAAFVHEGQCRIYERTHVLEIEEGEPCRVVTSRGTVRARKVVLATHTPLGIDLVHTVVAPYRSYVLTARVAESFPEALFWDTAEPYNYLRWTRSNGAELLVVGGQDHKTAHDNELEAFEKLDRYTRERFQVSEVPHRWSAQVFDPSDGLPLVGLRMGSSHVYLATGYSGDGMTFGTMAAELLTELLQGRTNERAELFRPTRFKPLASAKHFIQENVDVAKRFVEDRLNVAQFEEVRSLPQGSGKVVRVGVKQLAVYRDEQGSLHALSAVCPHLRCIVRFNPAERTWDCPCHGSRFTVRGRPIDGPATTALSPVVIEDAVRPEHKE